VQHEPFTSIAKAVEEGQDIKSTYQLVEMTNRRMMVKDTDVGHDLEAQIVELEKLLSAYRSGSIKERAWRPITNKS
jgi:fructose-1,6-bisphosphatase-3